MGDRSMAWGVVAIGVALAGVACRSAQTPGAQRPAVAAPRPTAANATPQAPTPAAHANDNQRATGQQTVVWSTPTTVAELAAVVDRASSEGRGVIIDVEAQWCVPCLELKKGPLADADVVQRLRQDYVAIRLDVSEGSDAQIALQARLDAQTLPNVMIWSTGTLSGDVLRTEDALPKPAATFKQFVDAAAILGALAAATAGTEG